MGTSFIFVISHKSLVPLLLILGCVYVTSANRTNLLNLHKNGNEPHKDDPKGRGILSIVKYPFLKPKHDYTDIDFNFDLPVPNVKIPDPTYHVGFDIDKDIPFKTWITLNPISLTKNLIVGAWKVAKFTWHVLESLIGILTNSFGIFKLWGAFLALKKFKMVHPGWAPEDDFFSDDL